MKHFCPKMKKNIIFLVIPLLVFALDLKNVSDLNNWKMLQEDPISVKWQEYKGFPISKAEMVFDHDINLIASAIQDIKNYPNIFERVTKTHRIESNIVQIVLDMPFPFSGRDYIIRYMTEKTKDTWIFSFYSVNFPNIKPDDGHVRLPNAAGVWILNDIGNNKTKVTYAWNGELLGNFPDFGLEKAWVTQGTEVLLWLNDSLSN